MDRNAALAAADALLAAASILFLLAGYRAIRARRIERHRAFMLAAAASSAAFMVLFVIRFAAFGFAPFAGSGGWKVVYYAVLLVHEPLAVINIPLVLVALVLGLRRSSAHPEVARPALLVWLVAAATGVLLFLLLYLVPL
jgi:putative membrane protein